MRWMTFGLMTFASALHGCAEDAEQPEDNGVGESVKLASFKMSNGNNLTLTALTSDGEIVVMETTPAGAGERFLVDDLPGASPLELFTRLTPEGTQVPEGIAKSATDEERAAWMSQRQITRETGAQAFRIDVAELGWQPIAAAGGGSCNSETGAQYFEDNHCGQLGPYGYGVSAEACDNGVAYNYWQRTAGDMRHTYTRTAACNGTGRIRHWRLDSGDWHNVLDEAIAPDTVATYYSYRKGGLKQDRRARSEPIDPFDTNAYVRQWVKFFDQVVSNAP